MSEKAETNKKLQGFLFLYRYRNTKESEITRGTVYQDKVALGLVIKASLPSDELVKLLQNEVARITPLNADEVEIKTVLPLALNKSDYELWAGEKI